MWCTGSTPRPSAPGEKLSAHSAAQQLIGDLVADLAVAALFLDTDLFRPYREWVQAFVPERSRISCRVAEGNGPVEATTTGSGNSLIIWCQFPPGLRGT